MKRNICKESKYWLFFIITSCNCVFGYSATQIGYVKNVIPISNAILANVLDSIKICAWKNDAHTCVNFSFDDNCYSHKKISEILDHYNFKGTFFVISSYMFVDSLKDMCARGHEIGSHSYSHPELGTLDSTAIDFQVRTSKQMIENMFGIHCVSFAEPYGSWSALSRRIISRYYLFNREHSEYVNDNYYLFLTSSTIGAVMAYLKKQIQTGRKAFIVGHGIDGNGYSPITKQFLVQTLDSVKRYELSGAVWVTTLKEGRQYENLYHELSLEKNLEGDTLIVNFQNYNRDKYKYLNASPISIDIPYSISKDCTCLTDSVAINALVDRSIFTVDLKKTTQLVVVLNDLHFSSNSMDVCRLYPNPVYDLLYFRCNSQILKVEIFSLDGKLLLTKVGNEITHVNISRLIKGVYLIKVSTKANGKSVIYWKKCIKR